MQNLSIKYVLVMVILLLFSSLVRPNETAWQYDIANIPPEYEADFIKTLESWQKLQDKKRAFNQFIKENWGMQCCSYDSDNLAYFTYPWWFENAFPKSSTYRPLKKLDVKPEDLGSLDVFRVQKAQDRSQPIKLHLKKGAGKTTLLFLNNVMWNISWDDEVELKQVYVISTSGENLIKLQEPNVKVVYLRSPQINRINSKLWWGNGNGVNPKLYQRHLNRISEAFGVKPRSIYLGGKLDKLDLNGISNIKAASYLPEDGLGSGQLYWEEKIVYAEREIRDEDYRFTRKPYYGGGFFPIDLKYIVTRNDIVQFAIDLDEGHLYIGLNGNWLIGDPFTKRPGIRIPPHLLVGPKQYSYSDDKRAVRLNTGEKPFVYKMPAKYKPYNLEYSDIRMKDFPSKRPPRIKPTKISLNNFERGRFAFSSPETDYLWANFNSAIVEYQKNACALTYAYRRHAKVDLKKLDSQCLLFFKGYYHLTN